VIIKEGRIIEVSLVKDPANPECRIQYIRKVEDTELPPVADLDSDRPDVSPPRSDRVGE